MEQVGYGRTRTDQDGCRRYLPHTISFDTQARLLTEEINPAWEPEIIAQHEQNRRNLRVSLIHMYGNEQHDRKIDDFAALGAAPWSVVDEHIQFMNQTRQAFAFGAYYPGLVGACALGERLLNELVIRLRNAYSDHPATTTQIATQKSFSNWNQCIEALIKWGVLDEELATKLNALSKLRHRSVHYGSHLTGTDARDEALAAILLIQEIIEGLFRPHGGPPRFIGGISGHSYLSLAAEEEPFVREFFLPASALLSPHSRMVYNSEHGWFDVFDDDTYHDEFADLTDEDFADHLKNPRRTN